jgi:hypothetical protein
MSCHRGSYNYSESQNNTGKNNGTKNMQPTRGMANDSSNLPANRAGNGTLTNTAPMLPLDMQMPSTVSSTYYTAGFLKQFLGRNMRVEFLIGSTGALVDRVGVLVEVGASYIVLQPYLTDDLLMCDLYSIKFVNIYGPGASFA